MPSAMVIACPAGVPSMAAWIVENAPPRSLVIGAKPLLAV
jgi:hypothetical protein